MFNEDKTRIIIGQVLQSARGAHRLTLAELGQRVGCAGQQISAYEKGKRVPTLLSFMKICDALGEPANAMMYRITEAINGNEIF